MTNVITVQQPPDSPTAAGARARTVVEVTVATVDDRAAVLAMVARCSRTSLFHRFHGFTDGQAYTRRLFERQSVDDTLVAWDGSACVGLGTLGRDEDGTADLGVLVEDAWQRRGVGSQLVASLIDAARADGASRVRANILGEDRFLVDMLRPAGPLTATIESGAISVDVDLAGEPAVASFDAPLQQPVVAAQSRWAGPAAPRPRRRTAV
jgi:GNAT superfamily N-acetyltransferase